MIVLMLEDLLTEAGFEIVGVATKVEDALASLESYAFDAAILDANLAGVISAPVASALTARAIPFLVVSGYAATQQNDAFAAGLRVQKPFQRDALIQALRSLLPACAPAGPKPLGPPRPGVSSRDQADRPIGLLPVQKSPAPGRRKRTPARTPIEPSPA